MPSRVHASYSRPTLPGWYARAGLPKTAFAASAAVSSPAPASSAPGGEASGGRNCTGDATATVVVAFAGAGRAADTSHSLPAGAGGGRDTVDGAASPPGPDAPERPAAGRIDAPRGRLGCLRHGARAAEVAAGESSILATAAPCEPSRSGSSGRAQRQPRRRERARRERGVPLRAARYRSRRYRDGLNRQAAMGGDNAAYGDWLIADSRSSDPVAPSRRADACVADAELSELSRSVRSTLRKPTGRCSGPSRERNRHGVRTESPSDDSSTVKRPLRTFVPCARRRVRPGTADAMAAACTRLAARTGIAVVHLESPLVLHLDRVGRRDGRQATLRVLLRFAACFSLRMPEDAIRHTMPCEMHGTTASTAERVDPHL